MPGLEKQRVLERVVRNGYALLHAAHELKADREIVLAALAQNGYALLHAACSCGASIAKSQPSILCGRHRYHNRTPHIRRYAVVRPLLAGPS